jgi:hypothetical protein
MSVKEIEQQIAELPPSELERIERFVRALRHVNESGWKDRVAQAHAGMDAGKKYGEEDLLRIMAEKRAAKNQ